MNSKLLPLQSENIHYNVRYNDKMYVSKNLSISHRKGKNSLIQ